MLLKILKMSNVEFNADYVFVGALTLFGVGRKICRKCRIRYKILGV